MDMLGVEVAFDTLSRLAALHYLRPIAATRELQGLTGEVVWPRLRGPRASGHVVQAALSQLRSNV